MPTGGRTARPRHELRAARVTMLLLGLAALAVLGSALVAFLYFEPGGERSGLHARVDGVHPFDPHTHEAAARSERIYRPGQPFAAQVDWGSLPAGIEVAALWVDSLGTPVGGVGPRPVEQLPRTQLVTTALAEQGKQNLPGGYVFFVERFSGGRPVEILARTSVYVDPGA